MLPVSIAGGFLPLQAGAIAQSPLGQLLAAIVVLAAFVLVGRIVLSVAWKLLVAAAVVVAGLLVVQLFVL